jgi:hypothetical protein
LYLCFNNYNRYLFNFIEYLLEQEREESPMKRRFLTILTASVLLLGVAGFANNPVDTASVQIQKVELPTTVY